MRVGFIFLILIFLVSQANANCSRFPVEQSTAFDPRAKKVLLPWRTDYPKQLPANTYDWEKFDFRTDWRGYMNAVLNEIKKSNLEITDKKIKIRGDADWWISIWLDHGASGRDYLIGLTKERGPDPKDLSPVSTDGHQVWAIGWYNAEGAYGLGQVFRDPCNPDVPDKWKFPAKTMSFKLLFTTAPAKEVPYLAGAPEVEAVIDLPDGSARKPHLLRLIQIDIAVRDPDASETEWVMGTFIWKGPRAGDGFFDNFVPVGLMWGNDGRSHNDVWNQNAKIEQSKINGELAGIVWSDDLKKWAERPYPGFQGRLNGPADNLRSSCLSCHGLAQWRRDKTFGLLPGRKKSYSAAEVKTIVANYFQNVRGGELAHPARDTVSLDYSLQLEAAFKRMCHACEFGNMTGPTPKVCQVPNESSRRGEGERPILRAQCEPPVTERLYNWFSSLRTPLEEGPPRQ